MAIYYVWSGAGGTANGSSWANAFLTLSNALSGKAAGDIFYLASDHAETAAGAITISGNTSNANPQRFISVNRAGSVPPVAADVLAGATISATSTSGITFSGGQYVQGLVLKSGGTSTSAPVNTGNTNPMAFRDTIFGGYHTAASGGPITASNPKLTLDNCKFRFGSATQSMSFAALNLIWRNGGGTFLDTSNSGSTPTGPLFTASSSTKAYIDGVDFSAASAVTTMFTSASLKAEFIFRNCVLPSALSTTAPFTFNTTDYGACGMLVNCTQGSTVRNELWTARGSVILDTTVTRTGGATASWKLATIATMSQLFPLDTSLQMPIFFWNDSEDAAITVTLEGTCSGSLPNTDDIWMEVEYIGSDPAETFVATTYKSNVVDTGTALPSSTATWSGGGGTPFKLSKTITPAMKGVMSIVVKVGKNSSTYYIDPQPVIT